MCHIKQVIPHIEKMNISHYKRFCGKKKKNIYSTNGTVNRYITATVNGLKAVRRLAFIVVSPIARLCELAFLLAGSPIIIHHSFLQ